jgi:hypothetical protein
MQILALWDNKLQNLLQDWLFSGNKQDKSFISLKTYPNMTQLPSQATIEKQS